MHRQTRGTLFVAATVLFGWISGCDDASSPSQPTPVTGVQPIQGTERLVWTQSGDVSRLKFRAYVDDRPVDLPAASCDEAAPAQCRSPLPPMTNGVHSIAIVNVVVTSGIESARTDLLAVQKISAGASLTAILPRISARTGAVRLETMLSIGDAAYSADIIATGIDKSAQLAALADGRLLIGNGDGRVLVLNTLDGLQTLQEAFDARLMLSPPPINSIAVASSPQFQQDHFIYLSFLAREYQDQTIFRVVRVREVGNVLGEQATLFEAPVETSEPAADRVMSGARGPRMAFGPDRLLYVLLPTGVEFLREPAASVPVASMMRLTEAGRQPASGPLRGIAAHPLGFSWDPDTGAMWAVFPGDGEDTTVRSLSDGSIAQPVGGRLLPEMRRLRGDSGDMLLIQQGTHTYPGLRTLRPRVEGLAPWAARLAAPVIVESQSDRLADVVAGRNGALFLLMEGSGQPSAGIESDATGVVVRLTPLTAPAAR